MRNRKTLKSFALALLMLAVFSSSSQEVKKKKTKYFESPKGWVYVPQGVIVLDKDTAPIAPFYMLATEVSNLDYKEFLDSLKSQGRFAELAVAQVDTLQWRDPRAFNEPYVSYYFQHAAYRQYPLVNISFEAAKLYCKWMTEKLRKTVRGVVVEVELPTREQWIWAAKGGKPYALYSWGPAFMYTSKGQPYCNFNKVGEQAIHYNAEKKCYEIIPDFVGLSDVGNASDITAPVKSYFENGYGLYNMNGNVAEMVAEKGVAVGGSWKSPGYDVRNKSTQSYSGPSTTVGFRPIFKLVFSD